VILSRWNVALVEDLLVGPGASGSQKHLVYGWAIAASIGSAVWLALTDDPEPWKVLAVSLIAFDIAGGAVACSMEPLQRAHLRRYASSLSRLAFSLLHLPHVLLILWLLSADAWPTMLLGTITLVAGSVVSSMASTSVCRGVQTAAFLVSASASFSTLSSTTLQGILLMALFYKLFVAFPSFQAARLGT